MKPPRYKVGETFVHVPLPKAQKLLGKDQVRIESEIEAVQERLEECAKEMKGLKVVLYAKFGKAINLD